MGGLATALPDRRLLRRQLEWFAADGFANGAAADALSANLHRSIGSVWLGDADFLQIWAKLAACDPGNFCSDATEIFCLTAGLDRVPHLGPFSADFTHSCHGSFRTSTLRIIKPRSIPVSIAGATVKQQIRTGVWECGSLKSVEHRSWLSTLAYTLRAIKAGKN